MVTLFDLAPMVGGAIFGLLYAPLVITGMHHMFLAVDLQLISTQGGTFIWPMIVMSNLAQGSAALGVFYMTRNARDKSMASTSAISAYFGITEPAMFGVNLRFKFPFYAALLGSALGSIFLSLNKVHGLGHRRGWLAGVYFDRSAVHPDVCDRHGHRDGRAVCSDLCVEHEDCSAGVSRRLIDRYRRQASSHI